MVNLTLSCASTMTGFLYLSQTFISVNAVMCKHDDRLSLFITYIHCRRHVSVN